MITSIDLNYFFDGNPEYDLRSTEEYKKNLNKCQVASEKLIFEIKEKSNEIINSFGNDYQNKIKSQKAKIVEKKK
jgi:hypothetical protein